MDWLFDTYLIVLHITALEEISNRPFAAGGHMVQNPTYWRAKKCDKTPLGNVNKEKSHFSSFEIVFCFVLESGIFFCVSVWRISIVPCEL